MKTKLFTFLVCTMGTLFSFSQTDTIADIDKIINLIRANLNSYKKVVKVNNPNGTRFVYFKDKDLKLIAVKAIEENTQKNVEWFYENEQLIYCETNWLDKNTQKITFTEKCYLNSGQLILWITQNKPIEKSTVEFKKMSDELSAYGTKIKDDAYK